MRQHTVVTVVAGAATGSALLAGGGWVAYQGVQPGGHAEALYAYDVTDPRKVAQDAEAIFTGTVVADTGPREVDMIPSTTWKVRVRHVIRGDLSGEVEVFQDEGPDWGRYHVGDSYVFATNPAADRANGHAQLYGGPHRPVDAEQLATWESAAAAVALRP
ncbi:hypothetical protein [Streptomyces sp. NPDC048606]|uniref:hypothetical protein n=1 Tax=Streptomyces sp. NPDC048606 TaxID=3154726 RepID=UPI0034391AE3